eukprot:351395-Chlamydomonas_euryale.AAC.7
MPQVACTLPMAHGCTLPWRRADPQRRQDRRAPRQASRRAELKPPRTVGSSSRLEPPRAAGLSSRSPQYRRHQARNRRAAQPAAGMAWRGGSARVATGASRRREWVVDNGHGEGLRERGGGGDCPEGVAGHDGLNPSPRTNPTRPA